jgi:hypothetical protein
LLASLPVLLRRTLRRLFARNIGPSTFSSMTVSVVQAAIVAASIR